MAVRKPTDVVSTVVRQMERQRCMGDAMSTMTTVLRVERLKAIAYSLHRWHGAVRDWEASAERVRKAMEKTMRLMTSSAMRQQQRGFARWCDVSEAARAAEERTHTASVVSRRRRRPRTADLPHTCHSAEIYDF